MAYPLCRSLKRESQQTDLAAHPKAMVEPKSGKTKVACDVTGVRREPQNTSIGKRKGASQSAAPSQAKSWGYAVMYQTERY